MIYTDVATGERTRKIRAHHGIINTLDRTMGGGAGIELVATGSDDGTVKIWEGGHEASKQSVATFELGCPVTAVCWSADGSNLYIGALDNEIHVRIYLPVVHTVAILTEKNSRSTTSVSKQRYQRYPVTQTPPLQLRSPPMGLSSFPLRSRHKPSSTMLGHSLHLRHVYTEYLQVHPLVSRIHCSKEPGAKTMVDNVSLLEALTGQLPFGMSRVQRFCTRFGLSPLHLVKRFTFTSQLPGHKGTVTSVDFHPKEPVSESALPSHRFLFTDVARQSSLVGKTVSCLLVNSNRASLSEQCTVPGVSLKRYRYFSSLAIIVWYTVDTRLRKKIFANKFGNSSKIETWDNLGHLFHVPHVSTPTNWVSVLVRTSDLNPVR